MAAKSASATTVRQVSAYLMPEEKATQDEDDLAVRDASKRAMTRKSSTPRKALLACSAAKPDALPLRPGSTPLMQARDEERAYLAITSRSATTTPDMKELRRHLRHYHLPPQRQQQQQAELDLALVSSPSSFSQQTADAVACDASSAPQNNSSSAAARFSPGASSSSNGGMSSSTVSVIRSGPCLPFASSSSPSPQDLRSITASSASIVSSASDESNTSDFASPSAGRRSSTNGNHGVASSPFNAANMLNVNIETDQTQGNGLSPGATVSRQQLLSGPCPICGDRISGFHYGIFSCESCKGFFKRTVQNKKNYGCVRGANCQVTMSTRKKCPACRFERCLKTGMKLEAIREDRTRGGRSTYQCSYAYPQSAGTALVPTPPSTNSQASEHSPDYQESMDCDPHVNYALPASSGLEARPSRLGVTGAHGLDAALCFAIKKEPGEDEGCLRASNACKLTVKAEQERLQGIPLLIQEILSVEHLWHKDRDSDERNSNGHDNANQSPSSSSSSSGAMGKNGASDSAASAAAAASFDATSGDFRSNLISIADHRLYKIVKWCKSLPLFKEITMDDQIALLINSWCELLLLSCCYRSMSTAGEIRISLGRSVTIQEAKSLGIGPVIERMINLTEHLIKLQIDQCEYVCLKVIILLTSDSSGLKDTDKVDACQKLVLEALQNYTRANYPHHPSKFGELLLRIPEVERLCQVAKESLVSRQKEGDLFGFNILMELLRGDH